MNIKFHGAARTVTGSCHLLTLDNGLNVLLDCGMFQGMGVETDDLNEKFGFDPSSIDFLLLSHAHIDHTGLIPKLVKEGFKGKIVCTPATKDLTEILLYDSAEIQTYEIEYKNKKRSLRNLPPYEPLFTSEHVQLSLNLFETIDYDQLTELSEGLQLLFINTGHLIGSAGIYLKITEQGKENTLFYSGDIGRYRSVLLKPPAEFPQANHIIMESTYGDKHHDIKFNTIEKLHKWIKNICIENGGQLIIPAFSVGRTQEVLYALNQLSLEKRLPEIPYFVDSPLSSKATGVIKKYTDQFNDRLQQVLSIDDDPFDFPGLKYIDNVEDSKRLTESTLPCVIISASGTADAGRVRHHINSCISKENCGVLLVGYCSPNSLGGQLLIGTKEVEIFNDPCAVLCEVGQIKGMSAHADTDDLLKFISCQDPEQVKSIYLVHGEYSVQQAFAKRLQLKGYKNVEIPGQHQSYIIVSNLIAKRA
ncbi:MBL fold metallo-hydrolase RNA specificity domain-containing protein [Flavisolibacter ginsengisoli]|jgi:metallo-beta-lactamase family protein|uniref:Metallo-beta-lactamase family protein n=1 Tax=Flavisolibacter ginsengisoli DSM 18119 TaxID=1121884 RepID=A0A1M4YYW9_9BACT|nr:MBL fold metallo-hydrolase [Flavisolibacter ginsengisoli]SHF11013.1 metallo-beta-lactamase family protein [Flavisolibacter ginsengisoli DSM 18119]